MLLTRGYWLADTACTQALWQAVMGQNPSNFTDDDQGPVEQVSWDDIGKKLLPKLARTGPGLTLRLPTEAEWEYAARCAGQAKGSFSWGEGITTDNANYKSSYPLREGDAKGEYRRRTMPVKSFVPNALGLWQMHGNVYEWTADLKAKYPSGEVVDPVGISAPEGTKGSASRVLRGGGWGGIARICRSARRHADFPDYRYIGFRLARGPLPEAGWAEPRGGGAARVGLGGQDARCADDGASAPPAARQRGRRVA